jgi:glycosyltransferase involved in cell wall biosynthesis
MKRLLVEGWRQINHSFAMVNQNQLLEWAQVPGLQVFHQEAPPYMAHWNAATLESGFSAADRQVLDALPLPDDAPVDCTFRIFAPLQAPAETGHKHVTFVVTEFGLGDKAEGLDVPAFTRDGNLVVTPTVWSRDRILEAGFDPDKVRVVPHGVRAETYFPMAAEERRARRAALGYGDEHVVFLNVGVATWNKGLDLLLTAFALLRKKHPHARLILKDHQGLYGIGVQQIMHNVAAQRPGLLDEQVVQSVSVLSSSLSQPQLRALYCVADSYVSPYRAEGFNLPVLEAMACGTRAIVTAGGATDDFVCCGLAERIPGTPGDSSTMPQVQGRYIEPDLDGLVERMEAVLTGTSRPRPDDAFVRGFAERMSWKAVADRLLALCV